MFLSFYYILLKTTPLLLLAVSYLDPTIGIPLVVISYLFANWKQNTITIDFQKTQQNHHMVSNCPSLKKYNPTFYLNGLLHTIISTVIPRDTSIITKKEEVSSTGICLDWAQQDENDHRLLFIMPGLTGDVTDSYINQTIKEGKDKGFKNICVYNYRTLSATCDFFFTPDCQDYGLELSNTLSNSDNLTFDSKSEGSDYHYFHEDYRLGKRTRVDLPDDLHHTLQYLQEKYHYKKILAIGCSYGAVQMSIYLGRFKEAALINGAVFVGPPFSMVTTESWFIDVIVLTKMMSLVLAWLLKRRIKQISHIFDQKNHPHNWDIDYQKILSTYHIRQFDEHLTSKIYGYKCVDSYYKHFSPINRIKNIKIPFLCISSRDDDVCNKTTCCKNEILLNENAIFCETGLGGHIGFIEGIIPNNTWFPKPSIEFLNLIV